MQISLRFQLFAITCFLMASFSIAYLSDVMTIWNGAESSFLYGLQNGENPGYLPYLINHFLATEAGAISTTARLLGLSVLTISLAFFFFSSKILIGTKTALITVLISIAGFFLPVLAKVATSDIWLFGFQLMAYTAMLRFLKKPDILFRSLFYLWLAGAVLIQPLSTLIIFMGSPAFIYLMGKDRKALLRLNPWLAVIVLALLFHFTGFLYWDNDTFIFNTLHFAYGKFLLLAIIGILPFFGYFLGALRDMAFKLKHREELSILFVPVVLFSIIAQSPLIAFGIAFLIAKQMILYTNDKYPFGNWIKTGAVINLTLSFFVAIFLMLRGLQEFGGIGFRVGLGFSIAYWSLGVAAIIGLFTKDKRLLWGAAILNGLMSFLILASAVYPLIETKRDVSRRLFAEIGNNPYIERVILSEKPPIRRKKMPLLAQQHFEKLQIDSTRDFQAIYDNASPKTLIIFKQMPPDSGLLRKYPDLIHVEGWDDHFRNVEWCGVVVSH